MILRLCARPFGDSHCKNKQFFNGNCIFKSANYKQMTFLFSKQLIIRCYYLPK